MSDPKTPTGSLRNPMAILAMALDRQADEENDLADKAAKRTAAAKMRELALNQPKPE